MYNLCDRVTLSHAIESNRTTIPGGTSSEIINFDPQKQEYTLKTDNNITFTAQSSDFHTTREQSDHHPNFQQDLKSLYLQAKIGCFIDQEMTIRSKEGFNSVNAYEALYIINSLIKTTQTHFTITKSDIQNAMKKFEIKSSEYSEEMLLLKLMQHFSKK